MTGIRNDLRRTFELAHEQGRCHIPAYPSEEKRLRRATARGNLVSPASHVYALPDKWNKLRRTEQELYKLKALSALHPDWVFCGISAAVLHRLWVTHSAMGAVHLAVSSRKHSRSSRDGSLRRHIISEGDIVVVDGVQTTSLARTVFDCLRSSSFRVALPIADSALRLWGLPQDELLGTMEQMRSQHHNRQRAIEIAKWADARSENGGESTARAVMIERGFLLPELQKPFPDPVYPQSEFRVDFFWNLAHGSVIGELDGHDKYVDPVMTNGRSTLDVLTDERLRESHLTGTGSKVMRFSYADVMRTQSFCHLMSSFGVPCGYAVPAVANPNDPINYVNR